MGEKLDFAWKRSWITSRCVSCFSSTSCCIKTWVDGIWSHDEALSLQQMVDHTLVDGILGLSVEPLVQGDGELEAGICLLVWESCAVRRRKYLQLSWHSWDVLVPLFWWVFFHVKERVSLGGNRIFSTLKGVIHRKKKKESGCLERVWFMWLTDRLNCDVVVSVYEAVFGDNFSIGCFWWAV